MQPEPRTAARLHAVSRGLPRWVSWRGQTIRTGIFKTPVTGPLHVSAEGVEGDGQADRSVHGGLDKAVYAMDASSVHHWQTELGRDDLAPGAFGENLTVAGWPETDVYIGDRFRIGGASFEVSQPRQPCSKLGLRMDDPGFPKRFFASGRVGYYLRVIESGTVQAGDEIDRIAHEEGALDVASLVRIWLDRSAEAADLERACALDALAAAWRDPLRRRLDRAKQPTKAIPA